MSKHIKIYIDKIILEGYHPADIQAVGEAVRTELTDLVSQNGLPRSFERNRHVPSLAGGPYSSAGMRSPQRMGAGIAKSVYRGMSNTSRR